jgi:hypothetical protein
MGVRIGCFFRTGICLQNAGLRGCGAEKEAHLHTVMCSEHTKEETR